MAIVDEALLVGIAETVKEQQDFMEGMLTHNKALTALVLKQGKQIELLARTLTELIGETPAFVLEKAAGSEALRADQSAFNLGGFGDWVKAQKEAQSGETVSGGLSDFISFAKGGKGNVVTPRS